MCGEHRHHHGSSGGSCCCGNRSDQRPAVREERIAELEACKTELQRKVAEVEQELQSLLQAE